MSGLVQQANNSATNVATTLTVTLGTAPTNGNCLVCFVVSRVSGVSVSTITGGGVTWIRGVSSNAQEDAEIWYGLNASSGGTVITITPFSGFDCAAVVAEFSGVPTAGANDGAGASANGTVNPADPGSITTTNANDLLLAVAGDRSTAIVGASNIAGWTDLTQPASTGNLSLRASYQIVAATGTYHDTWTISGATAWEAEIYALMVNPSVAIPGGQVLARVQSFGRSNARPQRIVM